MSDANIYINIYKYNVLFYVVPSDESEGRSYTCYISIFPPSFFFGPLSWTLTDVFSQIGQTTWELPSILCLKCKSRVFNFSRLVMKWHCCKCILLGGKKDFHPFFLILIFVVAEIKFSIVFNFLEHAKIICLLVEIKQNTKAS